MKATVTSLKRERERERKIVRKKKIGDRGRGEEEDIEFQCSRKNRILNVSGREIGCLVD